MEAKDTVMSFAKQAEVMERAKIKAGCLIKEQAEISFRLGIKEAVGWVNKTGMWLKFSEVLLEDWQAKLKEWGL